MLKGLYGNMSNTKNLGGGPSSKFRVAKNGKISLDVGDGLDEHI
jgi:hypothetical protein